MSEIPLQLYRRNIQMFSHATFCDLKRIPDLKKAAL